jgi:Tol biopolymer transport system component
MDMREELSIWGATIGALAAAAVASLTAGAAPASSGVPATSDSKELIAFVRYPGRGGISVIPTNGGRQQDLTARHGAPWYFSQGGPPVWSPDGRWIAFVDSRHVPRGHKCLTDDDYACPSEISMIRPDGTGERRVTESALDISSPVWSPNGKMFVYRRQGGLRLINVDGSGERRLTRIQRPHYEGSPSWSPDGRSIALVIEDEVFITDLRGNLRRISNLHGRRVGPIRTLTWSPNGAWIAFSAYEPYFRGLEQIFLIDTTGRTQRRLTRAHPDPYGMSWSPDSKRIAFGAAGDSAVGGLFTLDVRSGKTSLVKKAPGLANWNDPSWSPDGEWLVAGWSDSGNPHGCWVMRLDGSQARRLVRNGHSCTWQPARR